MGLGETFLLVNATAYLRDWSATFVACLRARLQSRPSQSWCSSRWWWSFSPGRGSKATDKSVRPTQTKRSATQNQKLKS